MLRQFDSMEALTRRCCTLAAVFPQILCYIVCDEDEEKMLRETIGKEFVRMGQGFAWYEIRREAVIRGKCSRIRLASESQLKFGKPVTANIMGMHELDAILAGKATKAGMQHVFYVSDPDGLAERMI